MRAWRRAIAGMVCGYCGIEHNKLTKGEPVLVLQVGTVSRYRCVTCAKRMFGEDPPAVIEEVAEASSAVPESIAKYADLASVGVIR